jgi:signal transduction histidine kinase
MTVKAGFVHMLHTLLLPFRHSLRAKFVTLIVIVQITLMGLVALVIETRQREIILSESQKRAVSLATHLAALSEGYLLSYNFIKLEQTVEKVAAEPDVAYAIVQLYNGKVAAYSGHSEKQGTTLDDPVSRKALQTDKLFIQELSTTALGGQGYDVAIPVFAPGGTRKWGTIRIGFSLVRAIRAIRTTSQNLVGLGIMAVVLGTGVAIFLASRLSRPIQLLVTGVNEVARGNYEHTITVSSDDEVGHLARRFEEMREALRLHISHLAEEKQRLEWANKMLKATQAQLLQSEKLAVVGKLAAKVAHEVNNPLAIIKTSLHIINRKIDFEDPNKENLVVIEEEVARIARSIKQLLSFARPPNPINPVQINEVIGSLTTLLEDHLAEQHIRLQLDLDPGLPVIHISLDQLKQVLLNLLKNAQEAMPRGGMLCLQTVKRHGGVTIGVTDTGIGISPQHLRSLFEPFFSTKQEGEGMGLGLAVSYSIIRSYGGTIEVESEPGHGTTFRIFLPEYTSIMGQERWQRHAATQDAKE